MIIHHTNNQANNPSASVCSDSPASLDGLADFEFVSDFAAIQNSIRSTFGYVRARHDSGQSASSGSAVSSGSASSSSNHLSNHNHLMAAVTSASALSKQVSVTRCHKVTN